MDLQSLIIDLGILALERSNAYICGTSLSLRID